MGGLLAGKAAVEKPEDEHLASDVGVGVAVALGVGDGLLLFGQLDAQPSHDSALAWEWRHPAVPAVARIAVSPIKTSQAMPRGVYEFAPLDEITPEHFRKQYDLNVLGLLLASQEAARLFDPDGGSVINISSIVATAAVTNGAAYSGTKGAVDAITRSLAVELGPRKIRVNSLSPGLIRTEGAHGAGIAGSDFESQAVAQTPLGRAGEVGDIAPVAVFLAADDSRWVTGAVPPVGGGFRERACQGVQCGRGRALATPA
ncbi:MAG: SDR family oxidoreductase [Gemmataceae bacterium]|nr:SDR family oxidoreductase [Gemmataceae bacterium]